jgi:hypothetical protein
MAKQIRLNAFAMNCVAHQSPGLWTHPRDRTAEYNRLPYWIDLAKTLERGRFDGLFLADVLGVYDVYGNSPDAALRNAAQSPSNDPLPPRSSTPPTPTSSSWPHPRPTLATRSRRPTTSHVASETDCSTTPTPSGRPPARCGW